MSKLLGVTAVISALLLAGCDNSFVNANCKHDCFTLDHIENLDEAAIQQQLNAKCEGNGAPKINKRTKSMIAAQCGS